MGTAVVGTRQRIGYAYINHLFPTRLLPNKPILQPDLPQTNPSNPPTHPDLLIPHHSPSNMSQNILKCFDDRDEIRVADFPSVFFEVNHTPISLDPRSNLVCVSTVCLFTCLPARASPLYFLQPLYLSATPTLGERCHEDDQEAADMAANLAALSLGGSGPPPPPGPIPAPAPAPAPVPAPAPARARALARARDFVRGRTSARAPALDPGPAPPAHGRGRGRVPVPA
ncbi:hypothetical protein BC936DRAFT_140144, partial [Jimgerdemannia flammicorona]